MGTARNAFTWLYAFTEEGESFRSHAQRAVQGFSTLAFVIYDPVRHREFARAVERSFVELDGNTGDRLLFFAPVNPPRGWRAEARHRRHERELDRLGSTEQLMERLGAVQTPVGTNGLAADVLAMSLGQPVGRGPCLVAFHHPRARYAACVPTGTHLFESQLRRLAEASQRLPRLAETSGLSAASDRHSWHANELRYALGAEVQSVDDYHDAFDGQRLARRLHRALGFLSSGTRSRYAAAAAKDFQQHIGRPPSDPSPARRREHLLQRAVALAYRLKAMGPRGRPRRDRAPGARRLSREAGRFGLPHADHLLRVGDDYAEWTLGSRPVPHGTARTRDFGPAVVSWAGALERFLADTVGHLMRQHLGVALPDHYWLHEPGVEAVLRATGRKVDFNAQHGSLWRPPALGTLRHCIIWASKVGGPLDGWVDSSTLHLLELFGSLRNDAAHARPVSEADGIGLRHALGAWLQSPIAARLARLPASREWRPPF